MALIECSFFSKEVFRTVNVNVILPLPDSNLDNTGFGALPREGQKFQVLYLLHGFSADHTDWQRFSRIESYAQEKQIAVVMPGVDNSYYANLPLGGNYYNYYTSELPSVMEHLFPISAKPENRFIAGLSMGGFGALKAALRNPQNYAAVASLSGAARIVNPAIARNTVTGSYLAGAYGKNLEFYKPEEEDQYLVLDKLVTEGARIPQIYLCCGKEDRIYNQSVEFRNFALERNVDVTFEDGPGDHNFDFWDPFIRRILNWMPLANKLVE